jgi:hypothetical protein
VYAIWSWVKVKWGASNIEEQAMTQVH